MKVEHVPIQWVHRVWEAVEPYLAEAVKYSKGEYTLEQIKAYVAQGQWALLIAANESGIAGAATLNFFNRANDRVAFITAFGGKFISNADNMTQLKNFVVSQGATVLEGAVRESVARLSKRFGFEEKYKVIEVKL